MVNKEHVLSFLYCFLSVHSEWEFPIDIGAKFLRIVGGYPTFLDFYFGDLENSTAFSRSELSRSVEPMLISTVDKSIDWICDFLDGDSQSCWSLLSKDKCKGTTQYSFEFWTKANFTCEKNGQMIDCLPVSEVNSLCSNVVIVIYNLSTTIHFVVSDIQLPSRISQMVKNFSTAANDKCATPYTRGISIHQKSSNSLEIPARNVTNELADFGKHSVHCLTDNFEQIRFEVNQTTSCKFKTSDVDCHFLQKSLRNALSFTSTYICNCGICDIPITVQQDPVIEYNSSVCLIPNHVTVFLSYEKGIVTGAHVRYHWRKYEKRETLITLEKTIIFLPNKSPSITKSRFSQQRGRFHCPSEVTCWRELWFPFTEWTLTPMEQQLVCLVVAFFIVFLTK